MSGLWMNRLISASVSVILLFMAWTGRVVGGIGQPVMGFGKSVKRRLGRVNVTLAPSVLERF